MVSPSNDNQLQLALQAFERDPQLSIRELARFYNILRTILSTRINGRSICVATIANLRKLTVLEEEVVVREVLDLDFREFPPRMSDVEDIANRLLAICDTMCMGPYWTSNFIKR